MSYTKIVLAEDLLDSDLPDDPFLRSELFSYFPAKMRQGYRGSMEQHQLRREIVVTQIVNQLVNNAGITYFHRLVGRDLGATAAELTRANFVAREIFGAGRLQRADRLLRQPARRRGADPHADRAAARWSSARRAGCSTTGAAPRTPSRVVDPFEVVVEKVMAELPDADDRARARGLRGPARRRWSRRACRRTWRCGWRCCPPAYMVLGVVETAARDDRDPMEVARVHFEVGERLGLPAAGLPHPGAAARATGGRRWPARRCATTCTRCTPSSPRRSSPAARRRRRNRLRPCGPSQEICSDDDADLARLSVALRVVRSLL